MYRIRCAISSRRGMSQKLRASALGSCRGFALPLTLAILAVGSILIAGLFLMARLEVQSGENGLNAARAIEAAEMGLGEIVAWWDPAHYNQLATGDSLAIAAKSFGTGGYSGRLIRLSPAIFQVKSSGWHQAAANLPIARRSLIALVRLAQEAPLVRAALSVVDTVSWDAGSWVSGSDTVPPGWGGCILDSAVAGLATPPTGQVDLTNCPGCIGGNPAATVDSSVTVTMLSTFGTAGYAGRAGRALFSLAGTLGIVAPQVTGTPAQCLVSDSLNWGEPRRVGPFAACGGHHPVIHAPGNLTLTGGRGQGMLLVDGDLELGGGFEFLGVVIVLGTVRNGPGGGTITGALLARNIALDSALSASHLGIHYSACVLPIASRGSSQAIPLPYRSWAQSF
jgi:hypothetical protein